FELSAWKREWDRGPIIGRFAIANRAEATRTLPGPMRGPGTVWTSRAVPPGPWDLRRILQTLCLTRSLTAPLGKDYRHDLTFYRNALSTNTYTAR
ncbi:hypothetical protein K523DRAFT_407541, partial [Schizophyllum commune Tattone D]